jgi:hypothetical protein
MDNNSSSISNFFDIHDSFSNKCYKRGVNMLSKEEMKDVYTRIDNLEADKKSLVCYQLIKNLKII